jgi:hypothetical protein
VVGQDVNVNGTPPALPASGDEVGVPASGPGRLGIQLWIHSCSTEKSLTLGWGIGESIVLGGGMSCTTATR